LGSYLRLIDFVYHSTLGLRVIKTKKKIVQAKLFEGVQLRDFRNPAHVGTSSMVLTTFTWKMAQAFHLALTGFFYPSSLDSGYRRTSLIRNCPPP